LTQVRIAEVLPPGQWPGPAADHITLDYDGRHRRRIALTADHGTRMLLDLPRAISIPHGAGLKLEDGRIVEVLAGKEALLEIRAAGPGELLKLAWHIGNRHLTAQMIGDRILIRRDHVIAAMLTGLGAQVREIDAQFDPEGGAYGDVHHAHDRGHDHDHTHGHAHTHDHGHAHHPHGHEH
jgi:urease accessory protein